MTSTMTDTDSRDDFENYDQHLKASIKEHREVLDLINELQETPPGECPAQLHARDRQCPDEVSDGNTPSE